MNDILSPELAEDTEPSAYEKAVAEYQAAIKAVDAAWQAYMDAECQLFAAADAVREARAAL